MLVMDALAQAGADLIELGIPYGDPLADGPTIAAAAHRALSNGANLSRILELVSGAEERNWPPIVYFTYVNPVDRYGIARFADAAAKSGAVGAIVPDLPLEESAELIEAFRAHGLALPLLIAPTTPSERARRIAEASSGFVYVVSRMGVTGARRVPDFTATAARVAELRAYTRLPLCVGFGVSSRSDMARVAEFADGAIVGSALVDAYAGKRGEDAAAIVRAMTAAFVSG